MLIIKCKKCCHKIKWTTLLRAFTISMGYKFECDNCKTKYYIRYLSRTIMILIMILPIMLLQEFIENIVNSCYPIVIWLVWMILVAFISPFFISLYPKEK